MDLNSSMKAILGPAGKIRVYVAKLENSSPHDGGVKHGGERGEEKVKDKREKERKRERAQKNLKYFVKESVLHSSTSQLDLISITIIQPAPGERGHERLPL